MQLSDYCSLNHSYGLPILAFIFLIFGILVSNVESTELFMIKARDV